VYLRELLGIGDKNVVRSQGISGRVVFLGVPKQAGGRDGVERIAFDKVMVARVQKSGERQLEKWAVWNDGDE